MFGITTRKKTHLERLLNPVVGDLEELAKTSDELNESVHKFIGYLANGLLLSAIDIAERDKYPRRVINQVSNGRFRKLMEEYQKVVYHDLQKQEA